MNNNFVYKFYNSVDRNNCKEKRLAAQKTNTQEPVILTINARNHCKMENNIRTKTEDIVIYKAKVAD